MKLVWAFGLMLAVTPAAAQQPPAVPAPSLHPDESTMICLPLGEIDSIVQAQVAEALAGPARRHMSEQLAAKRSPAPMSMLSSPGLSTAPGPTSSRLSGPPSEAGSLMQPRPPQ